MTRRRPSQREFPHTARNLYGLLVTSRDMVDHLTENIQNYEIALEDLLTESATKLGVSVAMIPADAYLLDVIAMIEVEPGVLPKEAAWMWQGMCNNKGTPILVMPRGDRARGRTRTVARYLTEALGVVEPGDRRQLKLGPTFHQQDVNPWHRYLGGRRLGT